MKRLVILFCLLGFIFSQIHPKEVKITRDKTMVRDGPGNFYDSIYILKLGTKLKYVKPSSQDPGWIEVDYRGKQGFVSEMALKEKEGSSSDPFGDMDDDFGFEQANNEIAPGSYTAAIKGFAIDYSKKKGYTGVSVDEAMKITGFGKKDFQKVMKETKLAYFPKKGELLGVKDAFINDRMEAIGLAVSLAVLKDGIVYDLAMTKRLNVIANILIRQTWDYDKRYKLWIIQDPEPVAFSGPGGYVFISDSLIKLLTDYRELVAVIGHEVGHIALRHGIRDIALEQARYSAQRAFDELDTHLDDDSLRLSKELEQVIEQAQKACALVRDDYMEDEADDFSMELLRRYKIDKRYLISALQKVHAKLGSKYPRYKKQLAQRINRIK